MNRMILAAAALVVLTASCGDEPASRADAETTLAGLDRPASATFDQGSFDFSRPIKGVASADEGRLASMSWDVYYVLDDGEVGSWGAGMDVFGSHASALTSAKKQATFWVCDGPREPVVLDDDGYDLVEGSTCKRPTEDAYFATVSASDGVVTANLTLAAHDQDVAAAALAAVWASMSQSTQDVVADLG